MAVNRRSTDTEIRTLVVGSLIRTKRATAGLTLATGLSSAPTLHDFGVKVVRYSNEAFQRTPAARWKEWREFLRAGGTALILAIEPSLQRHAGRLLSKSFPRLVG